MEILRIILIVLCSVLAAVLLLLLLVIFCRIKIEAVYGAEKYIKVRFLFLRFKFSEKTLQKAKKKQKKEKKPKKVKAVKAEKTESAAKKEKKPSEIEDKLKNLSVSDVFTIIDGVVQKFIKKLYFNLIMLNIDAATPEADKTALLYGELNAAIYPILGFIDAAGMLGKTKINIVPDFTKTKTEVNAKIVVSTRVLYLLSILLYLKKENII